MEKLLDHLGREEGIRLFLFGGRGEEQRILENWAARYPHTFSLAGRYALDQELALMSRLNLMLSMDSANMHLASLVGLRVLSFWGATHPWAGFYAYGQDPADAVGADLPCRPCSVYGNKPCYRGDWACLHGIPYTVLLERIRLLR
jgi:ADP-heptose:LPS heptosyltransferase